MASNLTIALAADHGGFILKEEIKKYLGENNHKVKDFGTNSVESCDYPQYGAKAAENVGNGGSDFGILICKTGFGMAIVANKVKGVRSAVCGTEEEAISSRRHNDCNVLSLAAKRVKLKEAKDIIDAFLKTDAEGGRHQRRVMQIKDMER